jgi:hypothetical protein
MLAAGCATQQRHVEVDNTTAIHAQMEQPEDELLDVGVAVFAHATAEEGEEGEEAEEAEEGSEDLEGLRKAEAHYIPYHLKNTLQRTGNWGAVRVTPIETQAVDVRVRGRVLASNGERFEVHLTATDATGRLWLDEVYEADAHDGSYRHNEKGEKDAYQGVYNRIANDLLAYRQTLSSQELRELRRVSEIRYASGVAPDAFNGYVSEGDDGAYTLNRLPARDDPMLARMRKIREREYMFIDTVNEHYAYFYDEMWEPYENWRKFHYAEAISLREMERKAMIRKVLGVAAVVGAVAYDMTSDGGGSAALRNLMIIGGVEAFRSGMNVSEEAEIHADAIRELSTSFDAEIAPQVLEVQGRTVELTGSAQAQFAEWRRMVREIYLAETGLEPELTAVDSDMSSVPRPE